MPTVIGCANPTKQDNRAFWNDRRIETTPFARSYSFFITALPLFPTPDYSIIIIMVTTRAGSSTSHHPNATQPAAAAKRAAPPPKESPPPHGFRVPYEVRPSAIAGRGVFATEHIERGTLVWEYAVGRSVLEYRSEAELRKRLENAIDDDDARFLLEHIYVWKDAAVEIIDDAKIWNHTPSPNTGYHPDDPEMGAGLGSYALRDIAAGEELTDDYGDHHELPWFEGMCAEYGCTSCTDLGKKIR